ncbi:unnamed protein product, partial [marine sediment metagenome]
FEDEDIPEFNYISFTKRSKMFMQGVQRQAG